MYDTATPPEITQELIELMVFVLFFVTNTEKPD